MTEKIESPRKEMEETRIELDRRKRVEGGRKFAMENMKEWRSSINFQNDVDRNKLYCMMCNLFLIDFWREKEEKFDEEKDQEKEEGKKGGKQRDLVWNERRRREGSGKKDQ